MPLDKCIPEDFDSQTLKKVYNPILPMSGFFVYLFLLSNCRVSDFIL